MSLISNILYDWNLLSLRYDQKDKRLRDVYSNDTTTAKPHENTLFYMENNLIHDGGLGDRLFGMISMYMFAKENGLNFKLNHCNPFLLSDYLEPNKYDWFVSPEDIEYNNNIAYPIRMAGTYRKYHGTLEQENRFMYRYLARTIKKHPGKEYHVYTNAHFANTARLYSPAFHELFKPSKKLQEAIDMNKSRINGKYVSVTLRFQNLLGDFYEGKFPTLAEDDQKQLINKVIAKIEDLHTQIHKEHKVLVTSDSRKFLDEVGKLDYVYTIPGKMVHMSYTPVHDFNTHLKSFVDLMMLADAQKLYLLVTGDMYKSGFAKSASFINNKPYEEVIW